MSLINRVLQHLDARSAQGLDVELHGIHVRAVMPKKHHGPMVWAVGAGAELRQSLGTAVFSGMIGVTLFGLVFTPVFYVVCRWFAARSKQS